MKDIITIANTYMQDNDGELPLLILAENENEQRVMRCHLRAKREQADQNTFMRVMRLVMIAYGYTSYQFVVKPEFDTETLQMTKNVWAVGRVTKESQRSAFYEVDGEQLVPYFKEMPIGGCVAKLLPSDEERQIELSAKVRKQIGTYVENCTYHPPIKVEVKSKEGEEDVFDALKAMYAS